MSSLSEAGFTAGFQTSTGEAWEPVIDAAADATLADLDIPELRTGVWTRLGDGTALGDEVTERILSEIAEETRAAATAQGYASGWAEGRRAARESAARAVEVAEQERAAQESRREAEHQAAVSALLAAAGEVRGLVAELAGRIEAQATDLAWAITEAIVGREVASISSPDVVRRALAVLPATPTCTVRLHPSMLNGAAVADLYERGVDVVPDPDLGRADVIVESQGSVADLRISEALQRVHEALSDPSASKG